MRSPFQRVNVIYIASIGRSGTTLLDCILGSHPEMASVGELHIWPHEIRENGRLPTGSGEMIDSDPFWQEMCQRIDPLQQPNPGLDHFREAHDAGRTLRLERLPDFSSRPLSASSQHLVDQYAENTEEVYRAFLDVYEKFEGSRPTWIVDSSKDPYRLCWLTRSQRFNLRVIHMVKHPNGFIYSVTKPHIHAEHFALPDRVLWTVRQAGAWSVRNHLIRAVMETHLNTAHGMTLRYEDLARTPYSVVEDICGMVDCTYAPSLVDEFRDGGKYAMAGNPMRQRSGGIRLDEKWKRALPSSSRYITQMITSVNARQFGY
jgi:hypothetical protein